MNPPPLCCAALIPVLTGERLLRMALGDSSSDETATDAVLKGLSDSTVVHQTPDPVSKHPHRVRWPWRWFAACGTTWMS